MPGAVWKPITANYRAGGMVAQRLFCPHTQVGTGSLQAFFSNPATEASAQGWNSFSGDKEQYLDEPDMAWAVGFANPYTYSVENEGGIDDPFTDAQIEANAEWLVWRRSRGHPIALEVTTDPNGSGVIAHHYLGGDHTCPGPGPREAQFPLIVARAAALEGGTTGEDMDLTQQNLDAIANAVGARVVALRDGPDSLLAKNQAAALARLDAGIGALLANPSHITTLSDADFAKIAKVVNDEDARRKAN